MNKSIAILGAGIAGISAGHRCKELGLDAVVFEAAPAPGGLVDNFSVQGFRFDNAIHLSFATEPEVREIFDRTPYYAHPAVSWCRDEDVWLKHPAQNNMYPLPAEQKVDLISGLLSRTDIRVETYRDWLLFQYGDPIARRWHLPYTEKYWTIPAEELGTGWIGSRVRRADIREVLHGAFTAETPNHYYASEMRYPSRGGYRAFIESMIAETNISCGYRVIAIDLHKRQVRFENGEIYRFKSLINTMPLPVLIDLIGRGAPDEIRKAASTLFATSVDLISLGFRIPEIQPHLWFYIYDQDIFASRAYSPSIKSKDNAPLGCSSLQFEIYSSPRKPQKHSPDEMIYNTVCAIKKMGIAINDDDILFAHHKHLPWGNVVFDLGMEVRRNLVLNWLEGEGIISAGRFGEWDYLWSNQALMSGRKAAKKALEANL